MPAAGRVRLRAEVKIAMRPPGVSTDIISSSALSGSANRCSAAKQQTASKLRSRNGMWVASARTYAIRSSSSAAFVSRTARVSIVSERSVPTTRPSGPTVRAKSRVKLPVPQAMSSTPSPGDSASSSRAMRFSSFMPGPKTPFAARPSAGRHQRS